MKKLPPLLLAALTLIGIGSYFVVSKYLHSQLNSFEDTVNPQYTGLIIEVSNSCGECADIYSEESYIVSSQGIFYKTGTTEFMKNKSSPNITSESPIKENDWKNIQKSYSKLEETYKDAPEIGFWEGTITNISITSPEGTRKHIISYVNEHSLSPELREFIGYIEKALPTK